MTQDTDSLAPVVSRNGEAEAWWWFGALAELRITAEQTGGRLSVIEITEGPGTEAPLHVHHRDDEGFWILEGNVGFEVGGEAIAAGPGDFVWGPRGIPHRYTVGDQGVRMLFIMTPGGLENAVRDMSVAAQSRTLPPASDEEPDWEHVAAVAEANGCSLMA